jgi:hypothetical protein
MTDLPSFEQLAALANTPVATCFDDGTSVDLTLTTVSPRSLGGGFETFSLQLQGPADRALQQGIWPLRFEGLDASAEAVGVFLVPTGERNGIRTYEAVFSRAATKGTDS